MKKSLKQNVNNSEYFRLSQMYTDSTFQEMQKAVSEKYAQYMAGPFPESEHQKPYENDGDYQMTEDTYIPWQYPPYTFPPWTPPRWPDPPLPGIAKGPTPNCKAIWDKYIASLGPGLTARTHSYLIYEMVKAGCTEYLPFFCCPNVWTTEGNSRTPAAIAKRKRASGELSIIGPAEVESGSTSQYTYIHAQRGCGYSWSAGVGRVVDGTYVAPVVSKDTSDFISVTPFMSDDNAIPCATRKVKILAAGCGAAVPSPTSLQMQVGTTQTLTVVNPVAGTTYSWVITAGGGSFSNETATTIDYTSAATNAECTNNATIELRRGTAVCGTVGIAVNAVSAASRVGKEYLCIECTSSAGVHGCRAYFRSFGCNGTWVAPGCCTVSCDNGGTAGLSYDNYDWYTSEWTYPNCHTDGCFTDPTCPHAGDIKNDRTPAQKTAGCCPIQLA
jgi:hypothetical protein